MKTTKEHILYLIMQILFYLAVPLGLIIYNYTTVEPSAAATGYSLGTAGFLLIFILAIAFKKVFLKRYISDLGGKIIQWDGDLAVETDPTRTDALEKQLHRALAIRDVFTAVPVIALLGLGVMAAEMLEKQLIKFSGCLGWIALSMIVGFLFQIVDDITRKGKAHVDA